MPNHRIWIIVGGMDRGGILVRKDLALSSDKEDDRLSYGALVEECELVGERLRYNLLHGDGPKTGWLSIVLPDKKLAVPILPDSIAGLPIAEAAERPAAMTFYAISDVHVERKANMEWLEGLPRFDRSTVIVAGDLGVALHQTEAALKIFQRKFDHVFYCYGNHETWAYSAKQDEAIAAYSDSFEKLEALRGLCNNLGVFTTAQLIENVWVVPVLGWYHTSWDTEPPLQAPPGKTLSREPLPGVKTASDTAACKWPGFENGSDELAEALDRQNEAWGVWPLPEALVENLKAPRGERAQHVISFSHFLPRIELMPEKRFLFHPGLAQIVGSSYVRDRVSGLEPDVHIFGHSHFPWDMTLDGVRYRSWPLGTSDEQARRISSYPTEQTELWHPQPIFDSNGRHYEGSEACWFSLAYTRIAREPSSCHMAAYVAQAFCPEAPIVPATIISPGLALPPETEADSERRRKYSQVSSDSMKKEVSRSKLSSDLKKVRDI